MIRTPGLRTLTAIVVLATSSVWAVPALADVGTAAAPLPAPAADAGTAAAPLPAPAADAGAAAQASPTTAQDVGTSAALTPAPAPAPAAQAVEQPTGLEALWKGLLASGADRSTAPAPGGGAVKETVDNPYGLDALWKGSDGVTKGTLAILVLMSAASWYVIFTKLFEQFRLGRQARAANRTFWNSGALGQALNTLHKRSAFYFIARSGVHATERHQGLLGHIDLNTWVSISIQRAIESVQSRLQNGLTLLATVGSTAPFVGLFGTVWGIYHALTAIGIAGQASIDKVAGPVGEALIMTAIGLAVAVPAVLGYNWLVRRNRTALEGVRAFAAELHAVVLGSVAESGTERTPRATLRAVEA
jgi:biopolymer transport protein ExbB